MHTLFYTFYNFILIKLVRIFMLKILPKVHLEIDIDCLSQIYDARIADLDTMMYDKLSRLNYTC